jgi:hypothetical protein
VGVAHVASRKLSAPDSETVAILVDGTPLTDLVREAESESAAEEGHPDLAGKYASLPWESLASNLLLGEATGVWSVLDGNQSRRRIPLLLCECDEPGCWSLIASIDVTPDLAALEEARRA